MKLRYWKRSVHKDTLMLWIWLLLLPSGCTPKPSPEACVEFYGKESTNRLRDFGDYDLEKQLVVYRCGLDHFPADDLSFQIANRGKVIIPQLLQRLERIESNDNYENQKTKLGILKIIQRIVSRQKVTRNELNVEVVENTVSEITYAWMREEASEALADINSKITDPDQH
jgi:hypothetical protein